MNYEYNEIREFLERQADLKARLKLIPYDGTPEIKDRKGKKYLYILKRTAGKLTSTYVDVYSEDLHTALLRYAKEARELKKEIRRVEKRLAELGYTTEELSNAVLRNIDFARANMKANIYDQAVLEGIATSFPQTEDIIENGLVSGVSADDVQKILNLKRAWEFVTDRNVVATETDYYILCHIAKSVNEGFYNEGGRIRGVPVSIGGTTYVPPMPMEPDVKERIAEIIKGGGEPIETAIKLCLYCMKTQIFHDGNKRAAVIFANHYLIRRAAGLLVIPEKDVSEFKKLLVAYYEDRDTGEIEGFMREKCWRKM